MKIIISESQLKVLKLKLSEQGTGVGILRNPNNNANNMSGVLSPAQMQLLPFSPQNLQQEINKQGIKYPDVAYAQAKLESAHFSSPIFLDNHNVFGMKLAKQRQTTAIGKNRMHGDHAAYNNWQDSVKDYKLWQDSNGMSSLPKDQYISKLSTIYCSPPDCAPGSYSTKVRSMLGSA